jgi:hypothetical protein
MQRRKSTCSLTVSRCVDGFDSLLHFSQPIPVVIQSLKDYKCQKEHTNKFLKGSLSLFFFLLTKQIYFSRLSHPLARRRTLTFQLFIVDAFFDEKCDLKFQLTKTV